MRVCTIIAQNYLAFARTLAKSFLEHNPGSQMFVLLLDGDPSFDTDAEPFRVVVPRDLGLSEAEYHRMAMIYNVLELATAVKPWLMRHLLHTDGGANSVTYLDPDIQVFAALDDVEALAQHHGIVLTPHTLEPMTRDDRFPSETDIMSSGAYNLGFLALGRSAKEFLDWWQEHLRRDCLAAVEKGFFVDQRWMDLGAIYFDNHVLRDPACNVAYWNLDRRTLVWTGERYEVNGLPLRFFHYSGFDPSTPMVLSKHQRGQPRIVAAEGSALARLCGHYSETLRVAEHQRWARRPYRYGVASNGLVVDRRLRRRYRDDLIAAEAPGSGEPLPPDPFSSAETEAFGHWAKRHTPRATFPHLDRRLRAAADRVDAPLRKVAKRTVRALGIQPAEVRSRITRYQTVRGTVRTGHATQHRTTKLALSSDRPLDLGVNLAGYVRAESGVGEVARLLATALGEAGMPFSVIENRQTLARQRHDFADMGEGTYLFDTNIVCVNADGLPAFMAEMGPEFRRERHTIGVWAWEVERFPAEMAASAELLDEIWVYSHHAASAVAPMVTTPVLTFPVPLLAHEGPAMSRVELGLPEGFLFLFCFDFLSVFERKNPLAVVEAFRRAFPPGHGPVLVLKGVSADQDPQAARRLRAACKGRSDIVLITRYFDAPEQHALMASCDAYVSLHRSEGLGLTIAEAMALGKPVVATGYSGNLEFLTPWNSWLVPYRLTPIPPGCPPYPEGARWAEPDVDAAASMLQELYENEQARLGRGERARNDLLLHHSASVTAEFVRQRLTATRRSRNDS